MSSIRLTISMGLLGETAVYLGCVQLVPVGLQLTSRVLFLVQSCNLQIQILLLIESLSGLFCAISLSWGAGGWGW